VRPPPRYLIVGGRRRLRRDPARPPERAPRGRAGRLAAAGVVVLVATVAAGLYMLGVQPLEAPEERGVGVAPSVRPRSQRGLVLSASLRFTSCDAPVHVTLVATGMAEYWIDRARALRRGGKLEVGVPGAVRATGVHLGSDGIAAPLAPATEAARRRGRDPGVTQLPPRHLSDSDITVLGARIRRWGRHLRPVVFDFDARWLERRDRFGSCYLHLPALVGSATVLSAQEVIGNGSSPGEPLRGPLSIVTVSSIEPARVAYYDDRLETTRGAIALQLGSSTLRTDLTTPQSDATLGGAPSWTCASSPPETFSPLQATRPGDRPEVVQGTGAADAGGAISAGRLKRLQDQRTCAVFAVIEQPHVQLWRDMTLLLLGVAFSLGTTLVVEGYLASRRASGAG
jgi:hypothetical protein